MKKSASILFILFINTSIHAETNISTERENEYKKWTDYAENIKNAASNDEIFENLSLALIRLKNDPNPDGILTYRTIQEAALKTPGFSQHFADHLLKLYENRLNAPEGTEIYAKATSDLQSEKSQDVMTLIRMPCEETVYAVGPLLSYPKFDERPIDEFGNPGSSMTEIAFKILNRLPIKNRPYPEIDTRLEEEMIKAPEAIEKWKQWFEDLKAGKIEVEFGPEVFRDGSVPPFAMRHGVRLPKPRVIKKQDFVSQIKESQGTWGIAGLAVLAASYAVWRFSRRNIGES